MRVFLDWAIEALTQPRAAARRIVALRISPREVALMLLIAVLVQAVLMILLVHVVPVIDKGNLVSSSADQMLILSFIETHLNFVLIVGLASLVAPLFGGRAQPQALAGAVAWMMLVKSFLTPLGLLAQPADPLHAAPSEALLFMAVGGYQLWLLASTLTEIYQFRSVAKVALVVIATTFPVILVLGALIGLVGGG